MNIGIPAGGTFDILYFVKSCTAFVRDSIGVIGFDLCKRYETCVFLYSIIVWLHLVILMFDSSKL